MKKPFILLVFLFIAVNLSAQIGLSIGETGINPFAKFGHDKHLLYSMSKGEFEEFHDETDIVEIGNVFFNTRTNQIVGFIDYKEEEELLSTATTAMQVDPMAAKYYWITPYAFCMNNPIRYVDPDGRDGMVTGTGTRNDPYVITANYYYQNGSLNEAQINGLNSAVSAYNSSGKKGVTEIKNSDGSTSYVRYNLSAQGVENLVEAKATTMFEDVAGNTRYYGNVVGTESYTGDEFGSANNIRIDFNVDNINAGIGSGMNGRSLNMGVAIHEIGHNLGGEHSDGTLVMSKQTTTTTYHQIGGTTTTSYTYSSMSTKFTQIIFNRRDTPYNWVGNLWTKKP